MQRLERLLNLTAALLASERPLTLDELRARVPGYTGDDASSRRAFERDKEALRELGVPLVVEPLGSPANVDGYRIHKEDYYLPDPGLAGDELAALHLAASAVHVEGADGMQALWKLGGEVAEGGPAATVAAALPGADHLAALFAAVSARRRACFTYRGRPRTVEPHGLSFRNGHWYLSAHDPEAGDSRVFRLDRIESDVEAVGEAGAFEPGAVEEAPQPWELGDTETAVTARLLVDASQAAWAAGHVGPEAVEERRGDGSVVLAVKVTNRSAFRSFVLGFLDHAEVLAPEELRDDMVSWLEALCRA